MIKGVAEKMPVRNNKVDLCILSQVLEHVNNPDKTMSEVVRILKLDGFLYLSSPNYLFPVEQHLHIPYFPLMNKSLFIKWVNFWLMINQLIKLKKLSEKNLAQTRSIIEDINYTTHKIIRGLCKKYRLKIIWASGDEARNIIYQIKMHWDQNPNLKQLPLIVMSIPKKIFRLILVRMGLLPMKHEYLIQKRYF